MKKGQSGVIARIDCAPRAAARLRALGLAPGTDVTLLRRAPAGDPIEIWVRGARIALRGEDAARIYLGPS